MRIGGSGLSDTVAWMMRFVWVIFAITVFAGFARAAEERQLSADEIMQRAVERAERQYERVAEAGFRSRVESEFRSLDGSGEVTKNEVTVARRYPLEGALFDELVEKDGRELTAKEAREEEKRKAQFIREVRKRKAAGEHPQPEKGPGVRLNEDLISRYKLTLEGEGELRGHACWKIEFEPKSGKLPVKERIDAALNKSTGRFWISQEDYGLVRLEFAMREPYKYWGGFLATINDTDATLEFKRVAEDVWVPESFDLSFDIKVLMMASIRRRLVKRWTDYRPAGAAIAAEGE